MRWETVSFKRIGMKTCLLALTIMLSSSLYACTPDKEIFTPSPPIENPGGGNGSEDTETPDNPPQTTNRMRITTGQASFTATLADNRSATAFKAMLPLTLTMREMNDNEKYAGLPNSLPTAASNPSTIQSGAIMLYGSSTLVLFYKTFSTSYSYTKIANIDNPSGLQSALGTGNISVKFELE